MFWHTACRLVLMSAGALLLRLVLLVCLQASMAAGQDVCDAGLRPTPGSELGYRHRGDRCEGIYVAKRSAAFDVVSFTRGSAEFDVAESPNLVIRWNPPLETGARRDSLHIRASSLRPLGPARLHYRLDVASAAASGSYLWPTNILRALELQAGDLGLLAWQRRPVGGTEGDVYLPLTLMPNRPTGSGSTGYTLLLLANVQLDEVFITVAHANSPNAPIRDQEPLGHGYYPAGGGIPISIRDLPSGGTYKLTIGARGSGVIYSRLIWFEHAR